MAGKPDLVGLMEIAEMFGVELNTPRMWRKRGRLPEPDWMVSTTPVWYRRTIVAWAAETGRVLAGEKVAG